MKRKPSPSYWQGTGRYRAAADALNKLVPPSGPCNDDKSRNKHLDRFRRASNCYYDLFNNGLCNRAAEFRALFKVGALPRDHNRRVCFEQIEKDGKVEAAMDAFVLHAAAEQGVEVKP